VADPTYIVLRTHINPRLGEAGLAYERAELAKVGAELRAVTCATADDVLANGRDADVIIFPTYMALPRRIIEKLEKCKAIVVTKVGTDNVDVQTATEQGIIVANLPDGWTNEVADQAMGLLLAVNRRIVTLNNAFKTRGWQAAWSTLTPMPRLRGRIIGIVGLGRIGRAMTVRAQAFGMSALAYDPLIEARVFQEYNAEPVSFDDLLRRADVVSLHVPCTDRTRRMINEQTLRQMKPSAVLINTARGPIVDEAALARALREGWIAGAGLDVFEKEPCAPDNPLLALDNVVATPHTCGLSDGATEESRVKPVAEVVRILSGLPPRPEAFVNPEVWTRATVREQTTP
jgi:D-3-phosphoglycerate dehydrogenase